MIGQPHGAGAHASVDSPALPASGIMGAPDLSGAVFFAVEMTTYRPGSATLTIAQGHGAAPHGAIAQYSDALESTAVICASDSGYRSDAGTPYPALLTSAFALSRAVNLDPSTSAAGAAWGSLTLANPSGQFDATVASQNCDGRLIRVLTGVKTYDAVRGIWLDPPYANLGVLFAGMATQWFLSDTALTVPLRDATYWTEQPLQVGTYGGTGGYDGPSTLAGATIPKARGGTLAAPIANVTPVQVDPAYLIYQYSDAAGQVAALYEGGLAGAHAYAGDTTDLYAGSVAPGSYRTDNSRGLFQLGSPPAQLITADVVGAFPAAGAVSTAVDVARYLLTEDAGVPLESLDVGSFIGAAAAYPYVAGTYLASTAATTVPSGGTGTLAAGADGTGTDAAASLLASLGAVLVPARSGRLRVLVLRSLPASAVPFASLGTSEMVSVTPRALPATLDPPTWRWRVGYQHNYTTQTSGLLAGVTAARTQYLAQADAYAAWSSGAVQTAYRRPNDHALLPGKLLAQADAAAVASDLGALWGVRRRLYDVVLPLALGMQRDIGDVVRLTWPMDDLGGGRLGQIVSEQFQSQAATITFTVLV